MADPFNYQMQVKSPFEAAVQGYALGEQINAATAQREANLAQQQVRQLQAMEVAQKIREAQALREEEAGFNQELLGLPETATAADYRNLMLRYPRQAQRAQDALSALRKEQRELEIQTSARVSYALNIGRPDLAAQIYEERARAAENSGRAEEAQMLRVKAQAVMKAPEIHKKAELAYLAADPANKDIVENITKTAADARAAEVQPFQVSEANAAAIIKQAEARFAPEKIGLDLQLTQAQIEQAKAARAAQNAAAAKSGAEAARAQAEANQISAGIIPADKRPEAETKLRKEYTDNTKGYQEVKSAYGRVLVSEDSAVGDLSLIFGYMKMLDPGSVVREGEFATAQNAAGVPERVQNIYNRVVSGERLTPSQRSSFKGQAEKLYSSARTQEATVRAGIERIARGYGLSPSNIFYEATETAPGAIAPGTSTAGAGRGRVTPAVAGQRNIVVDY
jgi:hypothetical protein